MRPIIHFFVLFISLAKPSSAQVLEHDSLAAYDFYNYNGFSTNGPLSTWDGVTVEGNRVTAIYKQWFSMGGGVYFPQSFWNLTALKKIKFEGCGSMCGFSFPASFSKLAALEEISVSDFVSGGNAATFMAPLFSLVNLKSITIQSVTTFGPGLFGDIPAEISNLINLETLDLSSNSFTALPSSIFNCPKLERVDFRKNVSLSGGIPDNIGNCTQLKYLNVSGMEHQMNGIIPASIGNCTKLRVLDLSGNNTFEGEIPASIINCNKITTLMVYGDFYGANPVLENITMFPDLDTLSMNMSINQTTHEIPSAISSLTRLSYLSLSGSGLSGSIPTGITNCPALKSLFLTSSNLSGSIPGDIGNLSQLKNLVITNCKLSGSIPESIGNLSQLQSLSLNNNSLTGPLPASFNNLNAAAKINLSSNKFTFDGMEAARQHFTSFIYSPQADLTVRYNNIRLSVSAGGNLASNTYRWYKSNALYKVVAGDSTLETTQPGNYYVTVNNGILPQLTLTSNHIFVPVKLCPPAASTTLTCTAGGPPYQWQMNDGTGYVNISDNANFSGTTSQVLQLNNITSAWNGYVFRCFINMYNSQVFPVQFETSWTGSINDNWEDPANWNCSAVPDSNTDVVIRTGSTVVLSSNTTIRSLTVAPGASLTVNPEVTLTVLR